MICHKIKAVPWSWRIISDYSLDLSITRTMFLFVISKFFFFFQNIMMLVYKLYDTTEKVIDSGVFRTQSNN